MCNLIPGKTEFKLNSLYVCKKLLNSKNFAVEITLYESVTFCDFFTDNIFTDKFIKNFNATLKQNVVFL